MKIIRYEYNGDGLFTAFDYLYDVDMNHDDANDFSYAENYFENNLPTVTGIDLSKYFKFYFTEAGVKKFSKPLSIISNLFKLYVDEPNSLNIISLDVPDNIRYVYKDMYQIVIQDDIINNIKNN